MSHPPRSAPAGRVDEQIGLQAGSLALLASVLWGGNGVAIKAGLGGVPPLAMAGMRFSLGILVVLGAALVARVPLGLRPGEWRGVAGLAAIFALQIYLLNQGTHLTTASSSTVLITLYPFFVAIFAHLLMAGDRLSRVKVAGMGLSFAGVALIFAESLALAETTYLLGNVLVLFSALLLGLRQVVIKGLVHGLHPYKVLFWQALLAVPVFVALSALIEREAVYSWHGPVVLGVLYQGLVTAGLCFILWAFLLRRHRASRLGVFGFVSPVCGVLLSALLLGEALSPALLISMVLVAAGIVVVNRDGS